MTCVTLGPGERTVAQEEAASCRRHHEDIKASDVT